MNDFWKCEARNSVPLQPFRNKGGGCYNNLTMLEPLSTREKTTTEEVAELERLLGEKKKALAAEGRAVEEKEAFKEVFKETHGESFLPQLPPPIPPPPPALKPAELDQHAEKLKAKAREEQLSDLVTLALTRGVRAAAEVARRATPWLMDELHDRLQDKYYEQLVELKKLKTL